MYNKGTHVEQITNEQYLLEFYYFITIHGGSIVLQIILITVSNQRT